MTEGGAVDSLLARARAAIDRVRPEGLTAEQAAGALVVDIRPVEQRRRDGELPGSVVVDRNVLEWRLDPSGLHRLEQVTGPDCRVVLVCNEGFSSSLAAATLHELGLRRATDLVGGYQAWRRASAHPHPHPSTYPATRADLGLVGASGPGESPTTPRSAQEGGAHGAEVAVRTLTEPSALADVAAFLAATWQTDRSPFPTETLTSLAHAGGSTLGAYDVEGRLCGATVAVFGPPVSRTAYSLVAGAAQPGQGVGLALKHAQRAWALEHGVTQIVWTFDPLVARNARFNLVKLGATAREYARDFYGPMTDGVNVGDESDRLTARWDLLAPSTAPPEEETGEPPPGAATLAVGPDGEPLLVAADGQRWCRVPSDVVALRRTDPGRAQAWRQAVREALTTAFDEGYVATSLSRTGWYRLDRLDREERP